MEEETLLIKNLDGLAAFADRYLLDLKRAASADLFSKAIVVELSGNLGSGKTAFSQAIARKLGIEDQVTSPTFVILKRYETKDPDFKTFIHIDAYRLENAQELTRLGFDRILEEPHTLICIEWPEQVAGALPETAQRLALRFIDENTREITKG